MQLKNEIEKLQRDYQDFKDKVGKLNEEFESVKGEKQELKDRIKRQEDESNIKRREFEGKIKELEQRNYVINNEKENLVNSYEKSIKLCDDEINELKVKEQDFAVKFKKFNQKKKLLRVNYKS